MVNILSGYGTHKKTVGTVEWPDFIYQLQVQLWKEVI